LQELNEESSTKKTENNDYGDLLLVDLLRPDWKHFFARYRVDFWGFVIISGIVAFIIFGTKWLAMIGAGE
jgi:hypothetical protein